MNIPFSDRDAPVAPSVLRREFSRRLSRMYGREVPLYDRLVEVVREVNRETLRAGPDGEPSEADLEAVGEVRHGAIRLGREDEMALMADFFAVLGMRPVGFYDLSAAGAKAQPVISTAFRPVKAAAIEASPFRVFCSLLRPEDERFFDDAESRRRVRAALARRQVFTPRLRELIVQVRTDGGLNGLRAEEFLAEGLRLFGWRGEAFDRPLYDELVARRLNIAADIACFGNPHLNHLTPNTLDIDRLQARMLKLLAQRRDLPPAEMKDHIEGPPRRRVPVLLRQTSYKALTEQVVFDGGQSGTHTARFGEIEQRGLALTPEGRRRYDEALARAEAVRAAGADSDSDACFADVLPDDAETLRCQGLGRFTYEVADKGAVVRRADRSDDLDDLVASGRVVARPIRYEDFLPVSAAGIFASNLRQSGARHEGDSPYVQADLEAILDRPILDADALAAAHEARSLLAVYGNLQLRPADDLRTRLEKAIAADPAADPAGDDGG